METLNGKAGHHRALPCLKNSDDGSGTYKMWLAWEYSMGDRIEMIGLNCWRPCVSQCSCNSQMHGCIHVKSQHEFNELRTCIENCYN